MYLQVYVISFVLTGSPRIAAGMTNIKVIAKMVMILPDFNVSVWLYKM